MSEMYNPNYDNCCGRHTSDTSGVSPSVLQGCDNEELADSLDLNGNPNLPARVTASVCEVAMP